MFWFFPLIASGLILSLTIAVFTDIKSREIPNWLVVIAAIYAVAIWTGFTGLSGLKISLLGGGVSFIIFLLFAVLGDMGMGDVKLMGATGCFFGWPFVVAHIGYTVMAGFVFAILWVAFQGKLFKTLKNLVTVLKSWLLPNRKRVVLDDLETTALPYGIAIAVGGVFTITAIKIRILDFFNLLF